MNKKNDIRYHEVLKQAAVYSYKNGNPIPNGYRVVKSVDNKDSGFQAEVLVKGNDIIIAYRGTDSPKDLINDVAMAKKTIPDQATDAIKLHDQIKWEYPNSDITVTGHSLGGSLSQIVSAIRGCDAVTFNAYGVRDMFEDSYGLKEDNIVNYVNELDLITMSNAENQIGETYAVKGKVMRDPHKLETMTELVSREYRTSQNLKKHKNIFNRVKNKIDYIASDYIEKLDNNTILQDIKTCVGSYPVSGYSRSDGTKVSGYIRTCGAKHQN